MRRLGYLRPLVEAGAGMALLVDGIVLSLAQHEGSRSRWGHADGVLTGNGFGNDVSRWTSQRSRSV